MEERAVFANMCMLSDSRGRVLVQNRKDPDWPGVSFPGGHVEAGESFVASVIREVLEKTGLLVEHPMLCGIKQFQTQAGARYVVLLFKANRYGSVSCEARMKERCSGRTKTTCSKSKLPRAF